MNDIQHSCFHCDLPVPSGSPYHVVIDGEDKAMCCPGCQAVASAIVDNGLTDFYRYRTQKPLNPQQALDDVLKTLSLYDKPELQKSFVDQDADELLQASLILEGIVCAACVWLNERHVMALPGVKEFRINYATRRARLKWDNTQIQLSAILKAITSIGYIAHPFDPGRQEKIQKKERSRALRGLAIAGLGAMQVMMLAVAMYAGESQGMEPGMRQFMRWVSLLITLPVVLYSAQPFFKSAWRDLWFRQLGMDVPVSLAIGIAFIASVWATAQHGGEVYFDSVTMFTFFLLGGRYLEMMARHRAGQAAEQLVRLLPVSALRVRSGVEEVISASELQVGDQVLVKPGETLPSDGVIVEGCSAIDESLLTGESMPVSRKINHQVVGGSINIESPLLIRIEKVGADTVLSSIVRLLDRAQSEKPRLAQLADKVAAWFVLVILILAGSIAWYWWQHDPAKAFWISLSVLVVTCPCALSLATPAALVAATGRLTRTGLLTTRGHALETLARANHIVFDKTGTLTHGRLQLEEVINLHCDSSEQALSIAAALESASEHPIARAIIEASHDRVIVSDITASTGRGLQASLDGKELRIGKYDYVAEQCAEHITHEALGRQKTVVALGDEQHILALFVLGDVLRVEAQATVAALKTLGMKVTLMSGDQAPLVEQVAQTLGIDAAYAGLLPGEKLEKIQALQDAGDIVVMVGDGVNDAPVLAAAQVSIAMGNGSQIAHASADMVLLSEQLLHLVEGVQVARKALMIIRQNLSWALVYNLLALPLAAMGMVAPWMAAIGMSFSSLVVVLNALRLTR